MRMYVLLEIPLGEARLLGARFSDGRHPPTTWGPPPTASDNDRLMGVPWH